MHFHRWKEVAQNIYKSVVNDELIPFALGVFEACEKCGKRRYRFTCKDKVREDFKGRAWLQREVTEWVTYGRLPDDAYRFESSGSIIDARSQFKVIK